MPTRMMREFGQHFLTSGKYLKKEKERKCDIVKLQPKHYSFIPRAWRLDRATHKKKGKDIHVTVKLLREVGC